MVPLSHHLKETVRRVGGVACGEAGAGQDALNALNCLQVLYRSPDLRVRLAGPFTEPQNVLCFPARGRSLPGSGSLIEPSAVYVVPAAVDHWFVGCVCSSLACSVVVTFLEKKAKFVFRTPHEELVCEFWTFHGCWFVSSFQERFSFDGESNSR